MFPNSPFEYSLALAPGARLKISGLPLSGSTSGNNVIFACVRQSVLLLLVTGGGVAQNPRCFFVGATRQTLRVERGKNQGLIKGENIPDLQFH